jgi:hypothetical protein
LIELIKTKGALNVAQKMAKGDDGGYYTPEVSEDGELNWYPSKIDMPQIEGANILGPQGSSGIYVGQDEPQDPNILVWLIPTGQISDYVMTETAVKTFISDSLEEVSDGAY